MTTALLAASCAPDASPAPGDVTVGAWAGSGGGDTFVFQLRGRAPDSLAGTVHVMRGSRKESELAITQATYQPPELEMYIASTDATYRGRVDLSRGRVVGGLSFGGRQGPDMDLRWVDPAELPGFAARPGDGPYVYHRPEERGDGWPSVEPGDAGLERGALEATVNAIARGEAGLIHSIVVARGGRLVLDEYFHGYGPDDLHRLASATKSVASLLVGAVVDRGLIPGVDEPLLGLLRLPADSAGPGWSGETLEDLLTMTMGLDWSPAEREAVHGTGPAFFRQVLARSVAIAPGTTWAYVNANVNLLAGVIHEATGQHADAFAREALFTPLGIRDWDWSFGRQDGYVLMDGSLQLRPRDLARIGAMVLAGGRWSGRPVVSEEWIEASTRTRIPTGQGPPLSGYGYLWWTGELPTGHGPEPIVVANGWGSQLLILFPRLDLVVATTGGNEDNGRHLDIGRVLADTLLPSL